MNPPSMFLREISTSLLDTEEVPLSMRQRTPQQTAKIYYSESATRPSSNNLTINRRPAVSQTSAAQTKTFAPGDIVQHMSFGRGEIISVKKMGSDTLYEIIFERVGTKKLMATYARLKLADK